MSKKSSPPFGTFCWNELMTPDTDKAQKFYENMFGWTGFSKDIGGMYYTTFMQGDTPVGGMFQRPPEQEHMPACWTSYVNVEDIEEYLKKVEDLEGNIIVPKTMAGSMGYFAVIQDPTGAYIALWEMLPGS